MRSDALFYSPISAFVSRGAHEHFEPETSRGSRIGCELQERTLERVGPNSKPGNITVEEHNKLAGRLAMPGLSQRVLEILLITVTFGVGTLAGWSQVAEVPADPR
jgi:hypothetical protein